MFIDKQLLALYIINEDVLPPLRKYRQPTGFNTSIPVPSKADAVRSLPSKQFAPF